MGLRELSWAVSKVLWDLRKRRPKQLRETLPPDFTAPTLRYIRIHACRSAAPKTIECLKWSQVDSCPVDPEDWMEPLQPTLRRRPRKINEGPFIKKGGYVCQQCTHPAMTTDILVNKLGLDQVRADFSARTLQRYMNSEEPMPVVQFRRAVVNAFAQKWLTQAQLLSTWMNVDQLEMTRKGMVALARRAMERKAYLEHREFDVAEDEVEQELVKQERLADYEATRAIDQCLKDKNLPSDLRQFMQEVLGEMRQRKTDSLE